MMDKDFANGKKLNLSTSMALFTVVMGFLFLLDASPGGQTMISYLLILLGLLWYFGDHIYHWWEHRHH